MCVKDNMKDKYHLIFVRQRKLHHHVLFSLPDVAPDVYPTRDLDYSQSSDT